MGDPSRGVLAECQAVLRFAVPEEERPHLGPAPRRGPKPKVWSRPSGSARTRTVFISAATRVMVV
jgi:hypothetical protein